MLSSRGHDVRYIRFTNSDITGLSARLKTAWGAIYSIASRERVRGELARHRPDVVHVHNFFPLATPSVYDACRETGVPVVQTLHNYRIICPGALLLRAGSVCEKCVRSSAYRAVTYRCYRSSLPGTLAVARMVEHHRDRGTWRERVDCFIALTSFAKENIRLWRTAGGENPGQAEFRAEGSRAGQRSGWLWAVCGAIVAREGLGRAPEGLGKAGKQSGIEDRGKRTNGPAGCTCRGEFAWRTLSGVQVEGGSAFVDEGRRIHGNAVALVRRSSADAHRGLFHGLANCRHLHRFARRS